MNRVRQVGLLAVLLTVVAGTLEAQQSAPRSMNVGVWGGVAFPTGDVAEDAELNTGYIVGGHLGWQPAYQAFGVRAEVSYAGFGVDTPIGDADVTKFGGSGNVILSISNDGSFRPYLIGGAGAYRVRQDFEALGAGFTTETETKLGLNGGVGASFRLGGLNGTLEARYMSVFLDGDENLNVIPITIGISF